MGRIGALGIAKPLDERGPFVKRKRRKIRTNNLVLLKKERNEILSIKGDIYPSAKTINKVIRLTPAKKLLWGESHLI